MFDRLEPALQSSLASLTRDPSFYGVILRADRLGDRLGDRRGAAATAKAVDRESALLLLTLRTPGPIPAYARRLLGPDAANTIAGLVLGGVLEIEFGGEFRSGPDAIGAMAAEGYDGAIDGADGVPRGRIADLSISALRHASMLPIDDVAVLAARLYRYNSLPLSPAGDAASTAAANTPATPATDLARLGLTTPAVAAALDRDWTCTASGTDGDWLCWSAAERWESTDGTRGTCKLYVSPAPAAIRDVFAATVAAATSHHALAFKAGAGPYGLLRPDKLVVYFRHRDHLYAAAAALSDALRRRARARCSIHRRHLGGWHAVVGGRPAGARGERELAQLAHDATRGRSPRGPGHRSRISRPDGPGALRAPPRRRPADRPANMGARRHDVAAGHHMILAGRLVLPVEVELTSVESLPASTRALFPHSATDFVLTRSHAREPSRVVDAPTAALLAHFRTPHTVADAVVAYSRTARLRPRIGPRRRMATHHSARGRRATRRRRRGDGHRGRAAPRARRARR